MAAERGRKSSWRCGSGALFRIEIFGTPDRNLELIGLAVEAGSRLVGGTDGSRDCGVETSGAENIRATSCGSGSAWAKQS